MQIEKTDHPDLKILINKCYEDDRGWFVESYHKTKFALLGISDEFVQDNHSSSRRWTLRGLHYQITRSQGKLVRVIIGEIFDVAVDLRKNSPYFGKWSGFYLSADNKKQLWIPAGFAHGFLAISDRADVIYKTTDFYHPASERTIRWDDPNLAIDWPIPKGVIPIISDKDANANGFLTAEVFT